MKQKILKYIRVDGRQEEKVFSENPPNIHAYLFWFFLLVLPILGVLFLL